MEGWMVWLVALFALIVIGLLIALVVVGFLMLNQMKKMSCTSDEICSTAQQTHASMEAANGKLSEALTPLAAAAPALLSVAAAAARAPPPAASAASAQVNAAAAAAAQVNAAAAANGANGEPKQDKGGPLILVDA